MSVEICEEEGGKVLGVILSGKLTKDDYQHFVPEVERLVAQHGKIRILARMHDFHGWTVGALWEDIKFDWKHFGRHRTAGPRRRTQVGGRDGDLLQAIHPSHHSLLRPVAVRGGGQLDQGRNRPAGVGLSPHSPVVGELARAEEPPTRFCRGPGSRIALPSLAISR